MKWDILIWFCGLSVVLGLVCMFAANLRHRILRRERAKEGFCRKCEYNLTGNVSGRCPECGTIINP